MWRPKVTRSLRETRSCGALGAAEISDDALRGRTLYKYYVSVISVEVAPKSNTGGGARD
jgi:hypothetical protein